MSVQTTNQVFIFNKSRILVSRSSDGLVIPYQNMDIFFNCKFAFEEAFLDADKCSITALDLSEENKSSLECSIEGEWLTLRELYRVSDFEFYADAQRAFQIIHWRRNYQYCPKCGKQLERKQQDNHYCMTCHVCKLEYFPRINPAVIMRITSGDKILLATRLGGDGEPIHSVLAGFVEPGESLEQAVVREVKEEVGIDITNVKYFDSQPWSFPNNLMLGFTAEALSEELKIDENEISFAAWYTKDNLPENIPHKISIARRLIDDYTQKN